MRARTVALVSVLCMLGSLGSAQAAACAEPKPELGEWRSYGHDLSNTRSQPLEGTIGPGDVSALGPDWIFRTSDATLAGGSISSTPVVADGCVYITASSGFVFALNADDGALVWKQNFPGAGQTLLGGIIVGSPVVENGVVYVGVSRPDMPYVAAMNQSNGDVLWTSTIEGYSPETAQDNALINASPVYTGGMIFQGFAGNEGGSVARGGFGIVDASATCPADLPAWDPAANPPPPRTCSNPAPGGTGGALLKHTWTIGDAEYAAGYRGASVWCTAAVDPVEKYAYACGGNPASKKIEHRYSNALLKIDLDRARPSFGEIVDAYKGEVDQYYPGLDRQPACDLLGDDLVVVWSLACLQLDLDFGSSPNLFKDKLGNLMLGDLQKSGIYHTLYAEGMQRRWTTVVGAPAATFNASSPATDGTSIYTAATPPGQMVALTAENGRYGWAMPIGGGTHFQSVSTANGVVYTMDNWSTLNMFDAASGLLMMRRPFSLDVGEVVTDAGSSGVAIARNTVYAASAEFVIAYR